MSDANGNTVVENYKGILQQYCHVRNLENPSYVVTCYGPSNEPSWHVEVNYGQFSYATPEPLQGSKRLAEQMAAKQVLESIKLRQEAFLAGESFPKQVVTVENPSDATESIELQSYTRALQSHVCDAVPVEAPIELIASALSVASERLTGDSSRSSRFRESSDSNGDNRVFAQKVADLTMLIVREVLNAAESNNVKFLPFNTGETSDSS